ncbi:MAG: hypothetical protein ACI8PZ_000520 [Myxococcota bacterium]|jgi:hypothetical protein
MPSSRRALGDYQTPDALALRVCRLLASRIDTPAAIVEPTCGAGAFLRAAAGTWPGRPLVGYELSAERRAEAGSGPWAVHAADAFALDWATTLPDAPGLLVLGNPPWGAVDQLARVNGLRPPRLGGRTRGDARTGAANFDASEWLLLAWLEALAGRDATVAMLVKTSAARRTMLAADRSGLPLNPVGMWAVDARREFHASVSACLFVFRTRGAPAPCPVAPDLEATATRAVTVDAGQWVADADAWAAARHLRGTAPVRWRSGVKHDCAAVMELRADGCTRDGQDPCIEAGFSAPFAKGADVARGRPPSRRLVLPHRAPGESTDGLKARAPHTWRYLLQHATRLDARRSRIWSASPRFGLFGLGPYSFAPWKVAAPCIHAPTVFRVIGPFDGEPVLLDDTCVFLPFHTEADARAAAKALGTPEVASYLAARAPEGAKRRLTIAALADLDWSKAADRA